MLKKGVLYCLLATGALVLFAGLLIKRTEKDRIAPGIVLCGREVSGMTPEELEGVVTGLIPELRLELHCPYLPENKEEVERRARSVGQGTGQIVVGENEVYLVIEEPVFSVCVEDVITAVTETSSKVKVWERLYEKLFRRPYRRREVAVEFVWREDYVTECMNRLEDIVECDTKNASLHWKDGAVLVEESCRGLRISGKEWRQAAEQMAARMEERLQGGWQEETLLGLSATGTVLQPAVTTTQAKRCDTIIGEFSTLYTGAGAGRAKNIATGASKLHQKVILPGEEFSVAETLLPFTEPNGYAPGGTYIDGVLAESIGGGVCQLSTTLYNALLYTKLDITQRAPHSMPVGYIPLGRDAAIAGDYKDLKFKNTTKTPVLLLCVATGNEVRVTLYGQKDATRKNVVFESAVTEEKGKGITVETWRVEKGENGEAVREKISEDNYEDFYSEVF